MTIVEFINNAREFFQTIERITITRMEEFEAELRRFAEPTKKRIEREVLQDK